jgi:hypothetical protein
LRWREGIKIIHSSMVASLPELLGLQKC